MCGILLLLHGVDVAQHNPPQASPPPSYQTVSRTGQLHTLQRRGPDSWSTEQVSLGASATLELQGSLLQLRGTMLGVSPVKDMHGNVLVLNGEVFGGLSIAPGANDSQALLQALNQGAVPRVFNCLRGPWAAVYWHAPTRKLWFGRDVLGRRSLLVHYPTSSLDSFCLVSAAPTAAGWSASPPETCSAVPLNATLPGAARCSQAQTSQPAATEASFQELQPGLYSMHFQSSLSQAPARVQVQHHDWQDSLLCSIRDFQRPKGCITPPQSPSSSLDPSAASSCLSSSMDPDHMRGAACTPPASAHNMSDSSAVPPAPDSSSLLSPPVATACQQTADDSQPKPGLHAPPAQLSFQSAVDLTLSALARSVAVRCQCIDQHKQPALKPAQAVSLAPALPNKAGSPKQLPSACSSLAEHGDDETPIQVHAAQSDCGCISEGRAQQHTSSQDAPTLQPGASMLTAQQGPDAPPGEDNTPAALDQNQPSPTVLNLSEPAAHPSDTASSSSEAFTQSSQTGVQSTNQHETAALQPAPVLILFSGGVDSTLIAALAHRALPPDVPIDLASVCFTGGRSADRQAALDALQELADFAPAREWRLIQVDSSLEEVDGHKDWLLGLLYPAATVMDLNIGAALWMAAKAEGHVTVVPASSASRQQPHAHQAAKLAGPEAAAASSVAAPHDKNISTPSTCSSDGQSALPQMTTYTAANTAQKQESLGDRSHSAQDACTGQEGGVQAASTPAASSSNHPLHHAVASASNTASTGEAQQIGNEQNGDCTSSGGAVSGEAEPAGQTGVRRLGWYRSAARVVLLGHGADEQHAGYGRHRTSFRNQAWSGLQRELAVDMQRLWQRNLGRDDRLVADTSREARHPFLDEEYIQTVLQIPLWLVSNLADIPGQGDKLLLRAALKRLGLLRAALRVKRAIQFGTGISKLSNVRSFGSNRAANGKNAGSLTLDTVKNT